MRVLRNVVDEDGHGARIRDGAEVNRQRLQRGSGRKVGRRTHEHGIGPRGGRALGQCDRLTRRFSARPRDEPLAIPQRFARESDQLTMFVRIEQRRLTRGAGHDNAIHALGKQPLDVLPELNRGEVTRRRVERCRDGRNDSRGCLLAIGHCGSMLDRSSVRPAGLSDAGAAAAAAGTGAGATRERRRNVLSCSWKSDGLDAAARAVS